MKKIYVGFDLDETLIHSKDLGISNEPYVDCDFNIMEKDKYKYSVYIRPNSILLLNYIYENFNLFFYTRAGEDYAKSIVSYLGFEDCPLFHSSSIDKTYLNTIYEGRKRFETKRLDKIAKKMKINIDDVIFFDDIKNNNEIRPLKNVVKVPAYFGSDFDNSLGKIYKLFKDSLSLNLNESDFKNFILNIDEDYLKEDYKIKEIKIIKNKIEP
jgi:ASC-1-like (ASCH) protein